LAESGFINFEAFGDLKSEVENRSSGNVTPKKVNDQEYIVEVTGRNASKVDGLNKRFPGVFQLSEAEKTTFEKAYGFEMLKLLREGRRSA
jgi:hypothetical protein